MKSRTTVAFFSVLGMVLLGTETTEPAKGKEPSSHPTKVTATVQALPQLQQQEKKPIRFEVAGRVDATKRYQILTAVGDDDTLLHVFDKGESTLYVISRLDRDRDQQEDSASAVADHPRVSVQADYAYEVEKATGKITLLVPTTGTIEFGEGDEWRWFAPIGDEDKDGDSPSVDCGRVNDSTWCCAISGAVRIICICWNGSAWTVCLDITL